MPIGLHSIRNNNVVSTPSIDQVYSFLIGKLENRLNESIADAEVDGHNIGSGKMLGDNYVVIDNQKKYSVGETALTHTVLFTHYLNVNCESIRQTRG